MKVSKVLKIHDRQTEKKSKVEGGELQGELTKKTKPECNVAESNANSGSLGSKSGSEVG